MPAPQLVNPFRFSSHLAAFSDKLNELVTEMYKLTGHHGIVHIEVDEKTWRMFGVPGDDMLLSTPCGEVHVEMYPKRPFHRRHG